MSGRGKRKRAPLANSNAGNASKRRKLNNEDSSADLLKHAINTINAEIGHYEANEQWTDALMMVQLALKCFRAFETEHKWCAQRERIRRRINSMCSVVFMHSVYTICALYTVPFREQK